MSIRECKLLARQRALANELDAAVALAEKALAVEPDEWLFLDHLAQLLTRRSISVHRHPDDQKRAAELAERAVDQLLRHAVPAAAALQGGTEPDLLDEVAWWQTDDF